MDYFDDLDTTPLVTWKRTLWPRNPEAPVFGGHFLGAPGRYDRYAIRYGYSELLGEVRGARHEDLELLANGQELGEELKKEACNPLFASDEDVGGLDPRVQPLGGGLCHEFPW